MAMINYGEEFGKLVVISDVVDHNRVSVELRMTNISMRVMLFSYRKKRDAG